MPDNLLGEANRAVIQEGQKLHSTLLDLLADSDNLPLVFHCTHGKDRAGLASAIVLMALGVSKSQAQTD